MNSRIKIASLFSVTQAIYIYSILSGSEYAPGRDAYWFIIQVRSILSEGRFHSFEPSPLYAFLAFVRLIITDEVSAYRVTLAITALLSAGALYFSVTELLVKFRSRTVNLAAAGLIYFSPSLFIMTVQYPKQMIAFAFLFMSAGFYLKYNNSRDRKLILASIVTLIISMISHRMLFVTGIYFLAANSGTNTFIRNKKLFFISAFSGLAAILVSIFVRGIFTPLDITRMILSLSPGVEVPLYRTVRLFSFNPLLAMEGASGLLLIPALLLRLRFMGQKDRVLIYSIIPVVLLFQIPLFDFYDLQIRLVLSSGVISYVLFSLLLITYEFQIAGEADLKINFFNSGKGSILAGFLAAIFSVNLIFYSFLYRREFFENDYERAEVLIESGRDFIKRTDPKLLILHKGFDKYMEFRTCKEFLAWAPDPDMDEKKIYRYVYGINDTEILSALSYSSDLLDAFKNNSLRLDSHYMLLREDLWKILVEASNQSQDEEYRKRINDSRNPSRIRPSYFKRDRLHSPHAGFIKSPQHASGVRES